MCQIIELKYPNGKIIEFNGSSCNCTLGVPNKKVNEEFAKWIIDTYQQAREELKEYQPNLILTMF